MSLRLFAPILAGATLRERVVACIGALVGIGATAAITGLLVHRAYVPFIIAPMGATAVLLFAVPTSPLAQPWSIVGGNTLSALVGVLVAQAVDDRALSAGLAVSLAILVMSFTRCLHPPGGASALTVVLAGPVVAHWGWWFPVVPVALNSAVILLVGLAVHRVTGRAYPHRPLPASTGGFQREDLDAALRELHETFDVDPEDLARLVREVERQAERRSAGPSSRRA